MNAKLESLQSELEHLKKKEQTEDFTVVKDLTEEVRKKFIFFIHNEKN